MNEHEHVDPPHTDAHEGHVGESYTEVMTDPAHFMAEITYEGFFFLLGLVAQALIIKWKLKKRDIEHAHCSV